MVNKLSLMGRKIEYKIRKEKRKSVLIEVYSNKLKTEPSKDYLQL